MPLDPPKFKILSQEERQKIETGLESIGSDLVGHLGKLILFSQIKKTYAPVMGYILNDEKQSLLNIGVRASNQIGIELLLESGADPNRTEGANGPNAVIVTAMVGHEQITRQILKKGDPRSYCNMNALSAALRYISSISLLENSIWDPNLPNLQQELKDFYNETGKYDRMKFGIAGAPFQNPTGKPLSCIYRGKIPVINLLLSHDVSPYTPNNDSDGVTPIAFAQNPNAYQDPKRFPHSYFQSANEKENLTVAPTVEFGIFECTMRLYNQRFTQYVDVKFTWDCRPAYNCIINHVQAKSAHNTREDVKAEFARAEHKLAVAHEQKLAEARAEQAQAQAATAAQLQAIDSRVQRHDADIKEQHDYLAPNMQRDKRIAVIEASPSNAFYTPFTKDLDRMLQTFSIQGSGKFMRKDTRAETACSIVAALGEYAPSPFGAVVGIGAKATKAMLAYYEDSKIKAISDILPLSDRIPTLAREIGIRLVSAMEQYFASKGIQHEVTSAHMNEIAKPAMAAVIETAYNVYKLGIDSLEPEPIRMQKLISKSIQAVLESQKLHGLLVKITNNILDNRGKALRPLEAKQQEQKKNGFWNRNKPVAAAVPAGVSAAAGEFLGSEKGKQLIGVAQAGAGRLAQKAVSGIGDLDVAALAQQAASCRIQ